MKINLWTTLFQQKPFLIFPTCLAEIFIANRGNNTINLWPWETSMEEKPKR